MPVPVDEMGEKTVVFDHGPNVTIRGVRFIQLTKGFDANCVLVEATRGMLFGLGECVSRDDGIFKVCSFSDRV